MLAAQIGVQHGADTNVLDLATSGPKRALVKQLGASYHTGRAPQAWSISLLVGCSAIAGHAAGPRATLGWVMTRPQSAATLAAG